MNNKLYVYSLQLVVLNLVLIGLSISLYNGRFYFWQYPFSYAGTLKTVAGEPNTLSSWLYNISMFLSGAITALLCFKLKSWSKFNKDTLFIIASLGFLLASISPDDIRHNFHVAGSGMFFASLWLYTTISIIERKKELAMWFWPLLLVLEIPVLSYAVTFLFNIDPLDYIIQKFALLGLIITLIYSSKTINTR